MSTTPSLSKPEGVASGEPAGPAASPTPPEEERSGNPFSSLLKRQTFWIFLVLVVLVVFFAIQSEGRFSTASNFLLISQNLVVLAVIAVGMTFVIITSGIDLSVGSVLVFSAVVSAKVMSSMTGSSPGVVVLVGILVAVVAGAFWGFINGFLVAKAKVPPLIVTLGSLSAALGLAQVISKGNDVSIRSVTALTDFGIYQRILGVPALVVVALVFLVIGGIVLHKTKFGRYTFAIGSNEEAARRVGIKVDKHLIMIYLYTGALAGVGAVMYLAQFGTTTIAGGTQMNLNVITAVVIGGTSIFGGIGTMFGTVVGLFIPAVLQSGLVIIGVQPFWQLVAVGAVLVAAVYVDQTRRKAALRGARTSSPFGKRAARKTTQEGTAAR